MRRQNSRSAHRRSAAAECVDASVCFRAEPRRKLDAAKSTTGRREVSELDAVYGGRRRAVMCVCDL